MKVYILKVGEGDLRDLIKTEYHLSQKIALMVGFECGEVQICNLSYNHLIDRPALNSFKLDYVFNK